MDYFLTDEQQEIRNIARQIAEEKIKPVRAELDEKEEFPWEILKVLAQADLFGLYIPEEYGGFGGGAFENCLAVEELSRACIGVSVSFAASGLGALPDPAGDPAASMAAKGLAWKGKWNLPFYTDAWDGYPWARERFYDLSRKAGAGDLVFLTGDSHSFWANRLFDGGKRPMGVEIGASGVTSPGDFVDSGFGDSLSAKLDKAFADLLEKEGIRIHASTFLLPEILAPEGVWTARKPSRAEMEDMRLGWRIAKQIGHLDIGQCVVVAGGSVLAVEAIEGTDAAITRAGTLCKGQAVVVKVCKPNQDTRFDIPAVGMGTIETMQRANIRALAIEAGKAVVFDRDLMIQKANQYKMCIVAYPESTMSVPSEE
jgi:hypothetical protein